MESKGNGLYFGRYAAVANLNLPYLFTRRVGIEVSRVSRLSRVSHTAK